MNPTLTREKTKLWRPPHLGELFLLRARYLTQTFARHTHDSFCLGVIEQGALGFYYRGTNLVASAGSINLAVPGEAHTGQAASQDGWTYRMFYLNPALLQRVAGEISGCRQEVPFFRSGVIQDDHLAHIIRSLHQKLERTDKPVIEQEYLFRLMLARLVVRHSDDPPKAEAVGHERAAVRRVREYLHSCYDEEVSIKKLAAIAGLSPFHLIRVFTKAVGLPPHTYLNQVRVKQARALLTEDARIADVAAETGFVDQSHLTRQFKRVFGVTPGQYRKIIQDRSSDYK
ncbi:MAG: AraC family transcriptional regulator [Clostridia bacterium]|nr:AraC family transcriptional regulator [Clostridia bacterium]